PVGDLLFVGQAAQRLLKQYGVETIGQLAACKKGMLETLMGKMGTQLSDYANGLEQERVHSRYEREPVKSVGNGSTFSQNLTTEAQVRSSVAMLADSVAMRLRHLDLYAGGVQVTLRDPSFHDRSRQTQFSTPTHLMRDLTAGAMELLGTIWKAPSPIRMLTITAIHLTAAEDSYEQVDLFRAATAPKNEKQEKLEATMDIIRGKYGAGSIAFGAVPSKQEEDPLP
ncbi:MAG: DNA polymerase IV, partial [Oscillibacter sp.]